MRGIRGSLGTAATLLPLVLTLACGGGEATAPEPPAVAVMITVSGAPTDGVGIVGTTLALTAVARDAQGEVIPSPVQWTSFSSGVASVSSTGVVTFLAVGTAIIRASMGNIITTTELSVREGLPVPAAGAPAITTSAIGGAVTVTIPGGAAGVSMLNLRAVVAPGPRAVAATSFAFGPEGTALAAPIEISIGFDPGARAAHAVRKLRIYAVRGDTLVMLPGGSVDTLNNRAYAQITRTERVVVADPPTPVSITAIAGDGQVGEIADTLAIRPAFLVEGVLGQPVAFQIIFLQVHGGSRLVDSPSWVATDEDGIAVLPPWILNEYPGSNGITATVIEGSPPPAVILATAVSPPGVNLFLWESTEVVSSGGEISVPLLVDLSNRAGLDLAQLSVEVQWDPARFTSTRVLSGFQPEWRDDDGVAATITYDDSRAATEGRLVLSGFTPGATTESFVMRLVELTPATASNFETTVSASVLSASDAAGRPLTVATRGIKIIYDLQM